MRFYRFRAPAIEAVVWADQGSGRRETLRRRGAIAFSFWHAGRDLRRYAPRSRVRSGRFGEFRSENRSIGCRWASGRLTVEVGWPDQEQSPKDLRSSLICSQSESYKTRCAVPELTRRSLKKLAYLFGEPLARRGCCEMSASASRRDNPIVAWHEVPGKSVTSKEPSRSVRYDRAQ